MGRSLDFGTTVALEIHESAGTLRVDVMIGNGG